MPQLIFKGIKREEAKEMSLILPEKLSTLTGTPKDYFTFEYPSTEYFFEGKEFKMYPLIEIIQFDRGLSIEKKMAEIVKKEIINLGYSECEVYFLHVKEDDYYE